MSMPPNALVSPVIIDAYANAIDAYAYAILLVCNAFL